MKLLISILFLVCCQNIWAENIPKDSISQKIAEAYGLSHFNNVEQMNFTFNAQKGDKNISNSWIWYPKTNKVSFKNNNKNDDWITYNRNNMNEEIKEIDSHFINDSYWPLFPFHLVWDSDVVIDVEHINQNISPDSEAIKKVIVKYGPDKGYTPGDVYELFVNDKYLIENWVYKRNGSEKPGVVTTWGKYKEFGPFLNATDFIGSYMLGVKDVELHIWLTDIEYIMDEK